MDNEKNIKKMWMNSLGFLDNCVINTIIVVVLLLYSSTIFSNINMAVANLYNFSIVKLIVLLLIIYVSKKDPTIGILLALSYLVSINYQINNENFYADPTSTSSTSNMSDDILGSMRQMVDTGMNPGGVKKTSGFTNKNDNGSEDSFVGEMKGTLNVDPMEGVTLNGDGVGAGVGNGIVDGVGELVGNGFTDTFTGSEHFFPMMNSVSGETEQPVYKNMRSTQNNASYPMNQQINQQMNQQMNQQTINTRMNKNMRNNNTSCMQTYVPQFESVGDVCNPVATFQNELNAQGLNTPEGFNLSGSGSPL
jgi:hypothetical protein